MAKWNQGAPPNADHIRDKIAAYYADYPGIGATQLTWRCPGRPSKVDLFLATEETDKKGERWWYYITLHIQTLYSPPMLDDIGRTMRMIWDNDKSRFQGRIMEEETS